MYKLTVRDKTSKQGFVQQTYTVAGIRLSGIWGLPGACLRFEEFGSPWPHEAPVLLLLFMLSRQLAYDPESGFDVGIRQSKSKRVQSMLSI